MKIRVLATNRFFYSDVSVICGAPIFADEARDSVLNPKVIVEVLSDSTERYDRGEKFGHYRRIDSLQEYVLVSQTEPLAEQCQPTGRRRVALPRARSRRAAGAHLTRLLHPGRPH